MGLFDIFKQTPITEQEQHEIMQEALLNVDLDGKHEETKKFIREVIQTYETSSNKDLAKTLEEQNGRVSLEEILHDTGGNTRPINKPLRAVGVQQDINIEKYIVDADYRIELLQWLEKMFLTDEHLGSAVKKVVRMLSTDYHLEIKYEDNTVLKSDILRELEAISFGDLNIYTNDNNVRTETNNAAINNMAAQLVIYGAISRMILINKQNKVIGTTPVNLKHVVPSITKENNIEWVQRYTDELNSFEYLIQFKHDANNIITDTNYIINPHRGVNHNGMLENINLLQVDSQRYLPLNPKRYIYNPALTLQDNPVGIPPLINAIAANKLERSMMGGVASYAEKFNAVSFLTVLVKPITAKNGEGRTAYAKRVEDLLNRVTEKIDNGFRYGYFIGFQGVHEISVNSTQSDAVGFNTLYKWAIINKSSGLGIPPLLLGVETQVSESLARILIQTMLAELKDYQDCLADSLHKFYMMYLQLNKPSYYKRMVENNIILKVVFNTSTIQDKLRQEQAKALEVNRYITMVNQGIISNDQAAQMLGFEKAYLQEPPQDRETPNKPLAKKKKDEPNTNKRPANDKINEFNEAVEEVIAKYSNNDFFWEEGHVHLADWSEHEKFADKNPNEKKDMFKLIQELQKDATQENKNFAKKVTTLMDNFLKNYRGNSESYPSFLDSFLNFVQKQFFSFFNYDKISKKMFDKFKKQNVSTIMSTTGLDNKGFLDDKFHKYFKDFSNHYLGKYITNPETIRAINKYLVEKVVTNEIVYFDERVLRDIRNLPNVVLPEQDYQLKRVISTTVSKYQNAGKVLALEAKGVTTMQVVSLLSNKTCAYCRQLHGTKFNVPSVANRYRMTINTNTLEDLQVYTPFVTSLYKTPDVMPTDNELLALSGVVIPFHPHCQCTYQIAL